MTGELKQENLEQVKKLCKEAGIVPVNNPANEDLRMKELKRLGMLEKDLETRPTLRLTNRSGNISYRMYTYCFNQHFGFNRSKMQNYLRIEQGRRRKIFKEIPQEIFRFASSA